MKSLVSKLTLASALLLLGQLPGSADQTGSIQVSAQVVPTCEVVLVTNLAFGAYSAANPVPTDASSQIRVRCNPNPPFLAHVTMEQGQNPALGSSCASPLRRMTNGAGSFLGYGLYRNAGRTLSWGCDASNDADFAPSGAVNIFPMFGRVPSGQYSAVVGLHTDVVQAVVTF